MIFGVDSTALTILINPDSTPPDDPETGQPLAYARERVKGFIAGLTSADTLIVPAPVLAEVLVQAGEGAPALLAELHGLYRLRIEPFGEGAAIELATMTHMALRGGNKRAGFSPGTAWQQVKFDRQIIAVARFARVDRLYADDRRLVNFARSIGMEVSSTWELPVPEISADLFSIAGYPHGGAPLASSDQLGPPSA